MTKDDALKFQKMIEDLCEQNNAFCISTHERKPDLKEIKNDKFETLKERH